MSTKKLNDLKKSPSKSVTEPRFEPQFGSNANDVVTLVIGAAQHGVSS